MSTSLRPTVKFSDSERAPTYLIITTSRQLFKKNSAVFLSERHRLIPLPESARTQTPVVMISVTESGNYWTFLFMPRARSKPTPTHIHTPTQYSSTPPLLTTEFGSSKQPGCPLVTRADKMLQTHQVLSLTGRG